MKSLLAKGYRCKSFESYLLQQSFQRSVSTAPYRKTSLNSICLRCQLRAFSHRSIKGTVPRFGVQGQVLVRNITSTNFRRQDPKARSERIRDDELPISEPNLPSNRERRRTAISKRLSIITDSFLTSLSLVSHRVNTYTGTDYTPITTLRNAISAQESSVRTLHEAVASAKTAYDAAHSQQVSSQKEVVGLLERKASWSATDLERYMALIRSEHVNEQEVATSLATLREKERELEQGRRQLEKMERQQYHEEQIWSDTIRRNSTWITIGLMGFNIVLLLVNIVGVEPWRRRKLVREFKKTLEEKTAGVSTTVDGVSGDTEKEIDEVTEPKGVALEDLEHENKATDAQVALMDVGVEGAIPVGLEAEEVGAVGQKDSTTMETSTPITHGSPSRFTFFKEYMQDIFSERLISLRKIDVTYVALQGVAVGFASMGIIFVVLRPK
ncbi:hypothetical protein EV356DRAFT_459181 [Viridothelium virens]|uniref:Sensitive to high expression protein 9, mitochondrial n=1 Tax=Viridothelium virens TaxID=1048519 RepID=A0A6A6HPW8_VIRVR|nr:hypothetical protein EV356DRAFT_459181 [Viridothelium virens]